jgi:cytochrome b subunit of formate dehydrogenase
MLLGALMALAATGARGAAPAPLPGSDDCLMCHQAGAPLVHREADQAPHFDADGLRASPHAGIECVACHADLKGQEFPHAAKLQPVNCGACHATEASQYGASIHGAQSARGDAAAPTCKRCHGTHDVRRVADAHATTYTRNVSELCGSCHRPGIPRRFASAAPADTSRFSHLDSIHGRGIVMKGLVSAAVCTSCHTAHAVLPQSDPNSSVARDHVVETCMKCHVEIREVHRKLIPVEVWAAGPSRIPVCIDCHVPHQARPPRSPSGLADQDCMSCHGRPDLKAARGVSMFVSADSLAHSKHAGVACAECHSGVLHAAGGGLAAGDALGSASQGRQRPCRGLTSKVDCSTCHSEVVTTWRGSTHGQLAAAGSPDAPLCITCHGGHGILGHFDSRSPTYARNIPTLCARCHRTGNRAAVLYSGAQTHIVENYVESIHGKGLLESGLVVTATCVDCHTAHGEKPARDPTSSVNPANVAATCSKCHRGIFELFSASIHSPTVSHSHETLPTCSDCHSAHTIARTDQEKFRLSILGTCGRCHRDLAESYFETYHGKVSKLGYLKTAKCFDCHGAHDILPPSDPRSHLSKQHIVATCSRCHPGANANFTGYLPHATHRDPKRYPALFFAFWGMTALLVGTFAVAGLHTLLWLPRSLRYRKELAALREQHEGGRHVRRFPAYYRNLHVMVIVSFLGLALTGMTLKFSHTGWAWALSRAFGGFESAGFIHRVCAVITFSYFALHLGDLIRRQRVSGLSWPKFIAGEGGMLPGKRDLDEFIQSLKWFLKRGPRPNYGRWTYWEKFDYFAVFWGVAIIGVTGLLLWFPVLFTRFLPGWVLNVATIIHSDEALLAVGFIFTVHFFNTHFRPEKFPMDTVIFTGTLPLEEFRKDRPREYAELVKRGGLEQRMEPAPDPRSVRAWKIFGTVALTLGTVLILLIILTAIFR